MEIKSKVNIYLSDRKFAIMQVVFQITIIAILLKILWK